MTSGLTATFRLTADHLSILNISDYSIGNGKTGCGCPAGYTDKGNLLSTCQGTSLYRGQVVRAESRGSMLKYCIASLLLTYYKQKTTDHTKTIVPDFFAVELI